MQFYLVDSKSNKIGKVTTEHKHVTVDTLDGRWDFNDWLSFVNYLAKTDYAIKNC